MRTLLALIASAGLVGCVGDVSDMPTTPADNPNTTQDDNNPAGGDLTAAKMAFDTGVYGTLKAKCSAAGCHEQGSVGGSITKFVATDAANGWKLASETGALVGNFTASAAPVLTMIKGGTHKGVTYDTTEESNIVKWLDLEVAARNGQTNDPGTGTGGGETLSQATERVLSQFAGCMQYTDFQAANMAQAWGGMDAQNNTECDNCHNNGGEGFIASRQSQLFYDVVSTKKYYFLQYLTVDLTQGAAAAKVVMNRASFLGVANAQDPHREHPRFDGSTNSPGWQALTEFYNATMTRVNTPGLCQPKPLSNM